MISKQVSCEWQLIRPISAQRLQEALRAGVQLRSRRLKEARPAPTAWRSSSIRGGAAVWTSVVVFPQRSDGLRGFRLHQERALCAQHPLCGEFGAPQQLDTRRRRPRAGAAGVWDHRSIIKIKTARLFISCCWFEAEFLQEVVSVLS